MPGSNTESVYDFKVRKIDGTETTLGNYRGKVLLIVNVASECGLTPQYEGLQNLYARQREKGLEILAFPSNDFGAQEPGSHEQIKEFCEMRFGVKFPLFEKIKVKGEGQHPLYGFLTRTAPPAKAPQGSELEKKLASHGMGSATKTEILWNFEKFLVNRKGQIVGHFSPDTKPEDPILLQAIQIEL